MTITIADNGLADLAQLVALAHTQATDLALYASLCRAYGCLPVEVTSAEDVLAHVLSCGPAPDVAALQALAAMVR